MSLRNKIQEVQHAAMKSKEKELLTTMRLVWSAIKNKEIEKKSELNDEEIQEVIAKQVKQLQDALKDFEAGGRSDLVKQAKSEIEILNVYLPEKISEEKLREIVDEVIGDVGATTPQDIGKVMGVVMKKVKGQADGNQVREIVSKKLSA